MESHQKTADGYNNNNNNEGASRVSVQVNGSPSELWIGADRLSWRKDTESGSPASKLDHKKNNNNKTKNEIHLANVIAIKKIELNKVQRVEANEDTSKPTGATALKLKVYYGRSKSTGHRLLKLKKLVIEETSPATTTTTTNTNIERIYKQIKTNLERYERARPKRLLIFVNPFGGKGKALQVYKQKVRRLLSLAGVETKLIVTRYANHARDTIEDPLFNVDYFDGIICVGGDGMFSELMNGLLFRCNRDDLLTAQLSATLNKMRLANGGDSDNGHSDNNIIDTTTTNNKQAESPSLDWLRSQLGGVGRPFKSPSVPIGVIGAGSTDCNSFGLLGTNDVITATLNIILGNQIHVDVCSVHSIQDDKLLRFVSTFIAYGYFGDVIRESERFRWLGPKRYDLTGLNNLIRNRSYKGLVRILTSTSDGSPHDLASRCHFNCGLCKHGGGGLSRASLRARTEGSATGGRLQVTRSRSQPMAAQTEQHKSHDSQQLSLVECRGSFVGVNAAVMACRCPQTKKGFSPGNHLANGCADLILVRPCSRIQYLNYLLRTAGTKKSAFDLKYVDAFRCRQFEFIAEDDSLNDLGDADEFHHGQDGRFHSSGANAGKPTASSNSLSSNSQQSSNSNSLDTKQSDTTNSSTSATATVTATATTSTTTTTTNCTIGSSGELDELGRVCSSWNADGEILNEQSIRVKVNNRLLKVFGTGEPQHHVVA